MKKSEACTLKKFQYWARACALMSQLPENDMDDAREIVREFITMAKSVGLLDESHALKLVEGGSGSSPSNRAIPMLKSPVAPE